MDCSCLIRGLRIAVSAVCVIFSVLLIGLWVRSYWWCDRIEGTNLGGPELFVFGTVDGAVILVGLPKLMSPFAVTKWKYVSQPVNRPGESHLIWLPRYTRIPTASELLIPCWMIVLSISAFAAVPWIRWSFRLRTLPIATTLIAVVLGLVVLLGR
jgi:hypothetical protein